MVRRQNLNRFVYHVVAPQVQGELVLSMRKSQNISSRPHLCMATCHNSIFDMFLMICLFDVLCFDNTNLIISYHITLQVSVRPLRYDIMFIVFYSVNYIDTMSFNNVALTSM